MREYVKISPRILTGKTAKAIRGNKVAQLTQFWLCCAPTSNMYGMFHCPPEQIAVGMGMTVEEAKEGLARLIEDGFCSYDKETDWVFVHSSAREQIGERLDPLDNRIRGIQKDFSKFPECFKKVFYEIYKNDYWLDGIPEELETYKESSKGNRRGSKAPLKGLERGSQDPPKPGTGTGTGTEAGYNPPQSPQGGVESEESTSFARICAIYPRGRINSKTKTFALFRRKKLHKLEGKIIAAIEERKRKDVGWIDGYVPLLSTFLNGEMWDGEIRTERAKAGNQPAERKSLDELIAEREPANEAGNTELGANGTDGV